MIGCGLLALVGSVWVDRYGGHVLVEDVFDVEASCPHATPPQPKPDVHKRLI